MTPLSELSQSPALIDSHVHIDHERFDNDRYQVIQAARAANVVAQVVPAVSKRLWPKLKLVCSEHTNLFACYGLHPCFCNEHSWQDTEHLAQWIASERPVAVGECGLDYHSAGGDKAVQQKLFAAQLSLAREFDLPIVIHANKAVEDVIRMIRVSGQSRGLVHSFNGSEHQAKRLIDLGYKLSFGGACTFNRATRLRKLIAQLPLHALLLETDAPDQPDTLHAQQRNQPAWLIDVWQNLSQLRPEPAHEVASATTANAIELFNLPINADHQSANTDRAELDLQS